MSYRVRVCIYVLLVEAKRSFLELSLRLRSSIADPLWWQRQEEPYMVERVAVARAHNEEVGANACDYGCACACGLLSADGTASALLETGSATLGLRGTGTGTDVDVDVAAAFPVPLGFGVELANGGVGVGVGDAADDSPEDYCAEAEVDAGVAARPAGLDCGGHQLGERVSEVEELCVYAVLFLA